MPPGLNGKQSPKQDPILPHISHKHTLLFCLYAGMVDPDGHSYALPNRIRNANRLYFQPSFTPWTLIYPARPPMRSPAR